MNMAAAKQADPYLQFLRDKIKLASFTGFDVAPNAEAA